MDGVYILSGLTYSYGAGESDVWLIKIEPEEDEDPEFYIQKNNNIAQRNFFNVGTSSPYTTTLTFENLTAKQMTMKIYAEVPNTDWAVDLCHPAKMENGKVVTPMVIPPYTGKEVTLKIIPDEEYDSGDVTISYDIEGYEEIYSDMFIFTFRVNPLDNYPPYQPMITGPTSGKAGVENPYTLVTTDPEGEDISYYFEWGDGINSGWTDFYDFGAEVTETHTWSSQGTYILKAKATNGYESEWTELSVSMPKNKAINTPFLLFLERLMERFPILEQILKPIYDKLT